MTTYFWAFLCVLAMVAGQLLFKLSSTLLVKSGSFFDLKVFTTLFVAMTLYGLTSIAWVWILQKAELGRIYPVMALAFILVPLGSHIVFNEKFSGQYFLGILLIFSGVTISIRA